MIYFISSFFRRPHTSNNSLTTTSTESNQLAAFNYFDNGTLFDLHVYLTEESTEIDWMDSNTLIWFEEGLTYGDWYAGIQKDGVFQKSIRFNTSKTLQNNGSIYLHAFVTKSGRSPNPNSGDQYAGKFIGSAVKMINKFKKIKYEKTVNLLTGETDKSEQVKKKAENFKSEVLSHWHPNITMNLVFDNTAWTRGKVPPPLDGFIHFMPGNV